MQPELALTTISHQFSLAIIGLCTVVGFMAAYFEARKMVLPAPYSTATDWDSPESQADEPE